MKRLHPVFILIMLVIVSSCNSQLPQSSGKVSNTPTANNNLMKTGADQTEKYIPYVKGKRIGMLANQTTIIGSRHLVDSFKTLGINIVKVFGPEHGFRGNASAGAKVADEIDQATGIPVISLYGPKNKPTKQDLADVDLMLYDLQDVGCRFYTNH